MSTRNSKKDKRGYRGGYRSRQRKQSKLSSVTIPRNFSLTENAQETIKCFDSIEKKLRISDGGDTLKLDFSEVENLSIDAIMYLIAFMQNQNKQGYSKHIRGNYPRNEKAKSDMISSGFLDFVKTPMVFDEEELKKEDTLMITVGDLVKEDVLAEVCRFVNRAFDTSKKYTRFIYTIIGELMANTNEHAYTDTREAKKVVNRWYLFVKNIDNKRIQFTLLDTGLGIPITINKRRLEKFRDSIPPLKASDSTYIFEALQGKHKSIARSRTKEENRNKGLPAIYDCYEQGKIKQFKIFSNHGVYYSTDELSQPQDLERKLKGTLFYWEIEKNAESEE